MHGRLGRAINIRDGFIATKAAQTVWYAIV
jgi:hypothetical protein